MAGTMTAAQTQALVIEKREAKRQRREQRAAARAERRGLQQERREVQNAFIQGSVEQLKIVSRKAIEQLRVLPGQIDAALRFIAGKDNDIIYRFLQILLAVSVVVLSLAGVYVIFSILLGIVSGIG